MPQNDVNLMCSLQEINGPKVAYVDIYDGHFNPTENALNLHSKVHCPLEAL